MNIKFLMINGFLPVFMGLRYKKTGVCQMRQMYLGAAIKYLFGVDMLVRLVISFILEEFVLKDLEQRRLLFTESSDEKNLINNLNF
jgi:hypothetical protein